MYLLPNIDDEDIARRLRALKSEMSILAMERESGVSRQVLYRIMGGSSISRSPYELAVKVLAFLDRAEGASLGFSEDVPSVVLGSPEAAPELVR